MNIYSKKQKWKWLLLFAATCIVASSLWVSSHLVHKISISEKRNVELWAEAVKRKALMKEATYQLYAKIKREEKRKLNSGLKLIDCFRKYKTITLHSDLYLK